MSLGEPTPEKSAFRNVAFAPRSPEFPHDDNPVYQDLALPLRHLRRVVVIGLITS